MGDRKITENQIFYFAPENLRFTTILVYISPCVSIVDEDITKIIMTKE